MIIHVFMYIEYCGWSAKGQYNSWEEAGPAIAKMLLGENWEKYGPYGPDHREWKWSYGMRILSTDCYEGRLDATLVAIETNIDPGEWL